MHSDSASGTSHERMMLLIKYLHIPPPVPHSPALIPYLCKFSPLFKYTKYKVARELTGVDQHILNRKAHLKQFLCLPGIR